MATLTRSAIIAQAIIDAGRKGQAVDLVNPFDFILQDITRDHPVLRNISYGFTTVANQAYVTLPADYRSWEQCFYDTYELDWVEPEEYQRLLNIFTDTGSSPSKYTILEDERKIYLFHKPSVIKTGYLYYVAIHPKSNKSLAFTSGSREIKQDETVTGNTSTATMVISFVRVTSGSWAGGDAAGIILGATTGIFQAETLNIGAELNVATIGAAATSADNFQHFLGEKFDDAVTAGVTWRCNKLLSGKNAVERTLVKDDEAHFRRLVEKAAGVKNSRRDLRTGYRNI